MKSPTAFYIHAEASRIADEASRRRGEDISPTEVRRIYDCEVYRICTEGMRQELEPINKSLVSIACMTLGEYKVPADVEELRQSIMNRWTSVHSELLGVDDRLTPSQSV